MAATEPTTETGLFDGDVHIDAPPEVVFAYLIDPELFVRWGGIQGRARPATGGIYRTEIIPGTTARWRVRRGRPAPAAVVYTFGWEGDDQVIKPGSSRVEIDLEPDGGGTRLRLRHSGLPEDAVGDHRTGWEHYVGRLVVVAAGGDPGRDPWLDAPPGAWSSRALPPKRNHDARDTRGKGQHNGQRSRALRDRREGQRRASASTTETCSAGRRASTSRAGTAWSTPKPTAPASVVA